MSIFSPEEIRYLKTLVGMAQKGQSFEIMFKMPVFQGIFTPQDIERLKAYLERKHQAGLERDRKNLKSRIISLIMDGQPAPAQELIEKSTLLTKIERDLLTSIARKDIEGLQQGMNDDVFRSVFNEEERRFFESILERLRQELPQRIRRSMEKAREIIDKNSEYLRILNAIYQRIPDGRVKEEFLAAINQITATYENIRQRLNQVLQGDTTNQAAFAVNLEKVLPSGAAFDGFTIHLLITLISGNHRLKNWQDAMYDTTPVYYGLGVEFLDQNKDVKEMVDRLLELSNLKIILPRPGDEIDKTMEYQSPGRPSEYPQNTVYALIRPGFIVGKDYVYQKAQVEISSGPIS